MGGRGASSANNKRSAERNRNYRQAETRVRKSVKSYEKRISEHREYIKNPKQKYKDWDNFSETRKQSELNHWKHEIGTFKNNIVKERKKLEDFKNGN